MKLLILFPNATNTATVGTAVPILAGIAKNREWELDYFDTYIYEKANDQESIAGKSKTGGFKSTFSLQQANKKYEQLVPDLQEKIDESKPNLIAITCLSPEYSFLMKFFGKVKIPLDTKVVIGGIHATFMGEEVTNTGMFDLVVLGEGEETFTEILIQLETGGDIDSIKGTNFFDRKTGQIVKNPMRLLLLAEKLWEIDRDFSFFNEAYFIRPFDGKKVNRNDMELSRGCPFHCAYCANRTLREFNRSLGKYVKTRPIESTIKEMKAHITERNINIFAFQDECFLSHPLPWLKSFMSEYKREINKPYYFMTRAETVLEERIQLLLSFDIPFQTAIGVESGSDRILTEVCERTCTVNKIIPAFELLNKHRIRTNCFFMVGLPFETRDDAFKSIQLCKKIRPSVSSISIFQPYPGSNLTQVCLENGFIKKDVEPGTFASDSLLNMPAPYLSNREITNLWRVFMLYAMLPEEYYKDIECCEHDYENNQELYNKLMKIRWDEYDLAKIKGDIKLV